MHGNMKGVEKEKTEYKEYSYRINSYSKIHKINNTMIKVVKVSTFKETSSGNKSLGVTF